MRRAAAMILRLVSVPVGVGIGVWTALLMSVPSCVCTGGASICFCGPLTVEPTFARWLCALFGAGAALALVLLAVTVERLPSRSRVNAA